VDLKLKNYSSGMSVRLGFSVAIQVDADVLLVDEVLAVGDASFQRKCFDEFERMKAEGRTILFVTHDMGAVERFCDRVMLLEQGDVVRIGPPDEVSRLYGELNFGQAGAGDAPGSGMYASILSAWCEDADGERIVAAEQGANCRACFEVRFERAVERPVLALTFRNEARHTIFVATSAHHAWPEPFEPGEHAVVRFEFENRLAPSRYTLTPTVAEGAPPRELARADDLAALVVSGMPTGGVVELPTELEVERR
jgi:ABC-type uncharacterized transport system ATPase subunit